MAAATLQACGSAWIWACCGNLLTSLSSLCFFAALSSGRYFSSSLNTVSARFLSAAFVKRFSAGGTCSAADDLPVRSNSPDACASHAGVLG